MTSFNDAQKKLTDAYFDLIKKSGAVDDDAAKKIAKVLGEHILDVTVPLDEYWQACDLEVRAQELMDTGVITEEDYDRICAKEFNYWKQYEMVSGAAADARSTIIDDNIRNMMKNN